MSIVGHLHYMLKLIGAKCLRKIVAFALSLKEVKKTASPPKPALQIELDRIVFTADQGKKQKQYKIPIDVYLPEQQQQQSKSDKFATTTNKELSIVINIHGSGFLLSTFGDDAEFCQLVANQGGYAVLDVSYSKAPERPYPHANDDIDSVLSWIEEEKELTNKLEDVGVKFSSDRVAITGFSSGGNLALTTCVRAKERGRLDMIKAVVAFYPSANLAESPHKKPAVKPGKGEAGAVMPPFMRQFLYSCYIPKSHITPRSSPTVSPINASSDSFPYSVTIITCEGDSLAREGRQTAINIQQGRIFSSDKKEETIQNETVLNGVLLWEAKGQGHAWDKMCEENSGPAEKRDYSYSLAVDRLKNALD